MMTVPGERPDVSSQDSGEGGDDPSLPKTMLRAMTDKVSGLATFLIFFGAAVSFVATSLNPVSNVSTAAWANWQLPLAVGVLAAVLGSYRYFQDRSDERRRLIKKGLFALVIVGALSTFACRETLQVIGAEMKGTVTKLNAHVASVRDGSRRNRCSRFAIFANPEWIRVELCIESRWREALVQFPLKENDEVVLFVKSNSIGFWVTAVQSVMQ
jgi:hypothetical protein